jgi:hypothetical protein
LLLAVEEFTALTFGDASDTGVAEQSFAELAKHVARIMTLPDIVGAAIDSVPVDVVLHFFAEVCSSRSLSQLWENASDEIIETAYIQWRSICSAISPLLPDTLWQTHLPFAKPQLVAAAGRYILPALIHTNMRGWTERIDQAVDAIRSASADEVIRALFPHFIRTSEVQAEGQDALMHLLQSTKPIWGPGNLWNI